MTRTELAEKVAEQFTSTSKKDVEAIIVATFYAVGKELAHGGKVTIKDFGTFETALRSEHKGRNPRTGEEIIIAEKKRPVFRPFKALKQAVNGGKS